MMMTSAQAFTAVDQVASDKEIDRLLVDLLRYPSPQTERLEDDPQLKKFIAEMVAPRLAELTGIAGAIDAMGNLIWRLGGANDETSKGLLLMGYAMTFPAASMKQPFSGAFVDGEAFGVAGAVRSRTRRMRTKGSAGGNDLRCRDCSAGTIKLARAANYGGELGGRDRPSRRGKIYFRK